MTTTNAPVGRVAQSGVWTGTEMIIWGGETQGRVNLNDGAAYNPSTGTWTPLSGIGAPPPRGQHAAVWTGSQMVIWGGSNDSNSLVVPVNSGGVYDRTTDSWSTVTNTNAPLNKNFLFNVGIALWTGSQVLIQGGSDNSGALYNPSTDRWTTMATSSTSKDANDNLVLPASAIGFAASTWMGSSLFEWGGSGGFAITSSGGIYNPASDNWIGTSLSGAPAPDQGALAVWTGGKVLLWGGLVSATYTPAP